MHFRVLAPSDVYAATSVNLSSCLVSCWDFKLLLGLLYNSGQNQVAVQREWKPEMFQIKHKILILVFSGKKKNYPNFFCSVVNGLIVSGAGPREQGTMSPIELSVDS